MSDEFQPFHAWLGLDKDISNPSFYELLGISMTETDKARISSAADSQLRKLETVPHGEHEPTRIRLIAQVNQAKNCLLDDEQRRGYDIRLKAAVKAGWIENRTGNFAEDDTSNSTSKQVASANTADESAWPPGYVPSANELTAKKTDNKQAQSTAQKKDGGQRTPESRTSTNEPPGSSKKTSSSRSNPGVPVVSAPIDDDLPQPITQQPITQQPSLPAGTAPPSGSESELPPTSVPDANASSVVPVPVVAPPHPVSAANADDSADLPIPIQPVPAQSVPTQPGSTSTNPATAEPAGQIPVAQAITDQPIPFQPVPPQPIASQPIATQPIAAQTIAAEAGIVADSMAQPTPGTGASGSAAERYRTLRRRSQIKAAIGGLLVLVLLGVGGLLAYQYRDSWLPMTKSPNFKEDDSGETTVAKIDPADIAAKSDSDDKAKVEKSQSEKKDNTNSVLVPINETGTDTVADPDAKSVEPATITKDDDTPDKVGPDTVVTDDPKTDPEMKTEVEISPAEKAQRLKDLASLGKLMESAKQALFDRKLIEADQLIAEAGPLATSPEHEEMIARLKGVADQIDLFWKTVIDECGEMQSLDEIPMSTSIIVVVESSPEKLVFRANGERSEYRPIELPLGLAMKIAERTWDPPTAESRITRGTVYMIDGMLGREPANLDKARSIFEEAALVGGNVQPFLDFPEDDYDLVSALIEQEDVPDEKEVAAASEKLKEEYRKNFSSTDRVALARQLLADAPGMADLPSRMAAFDLAADLATATTEIPLLIEVVDTQAKWFKTDSDEVKASRVEDVVKRRMSVEMAKELTRTAFELVESAREAKNLELAARYVKVAVSAAAKSKDADLRNAASELNLQIREELKDQK